MARKTPHMQNGKIFESMYSAVIYKDSTTYDYNKVLDALITYPEYAFIEHDLECVHGIKLHTHILLRLPAQKQINVLAKELGLSEVDLKWRNNFKESIKYLTHESKGCASDVASGKKFIYPHSKIICSFSDDDLEKYYTKSQVEKDDEEISKVMILINFIESGKCKNTRDLIRYSCEYKCWSVLRRAGHLFTDSLQEVKNELLTKQYREKFDERFKEKYQNDIGSNTFSDASNVPF